ncbi:MAG: zinc ABC transporter substrate-binding protein [Bacteriovorax sp.]|jgi:hypothetical protein
MKIACLTFILFIGLISLQANAASTIYCSHAELCKMVSEISRLETETLVNISGDPHEFEPSSSEIKNLIKAPVLLTGPYELNPWIKKIIFQRSKTPGLVTISLLLAPKDLNSYPNASAEALSHFWLYPRIYCSLKSGLEAELKKSGYSVATNKACDSETVEKTLQSSLTKVSIPIILTHDAILPLLLSLAKGHTAPIAAIKGSGHHEEVSPAAVKKMYDALGFPRTIWVLESGINIPTNILNKIRPSDKIIRLNTASTKTGNPFSVLSELSEKLNQTVEN